MNRAELIESMATDTKMTKTACEVWLSAFVSNVENNIKKDDGVKLIGFGTFSSGKRAARMGRNPKTGEPLKIAAAKTVKFSAGKAFKDSVNKRKK